MLIILNNCDILLSLYWFVLSFYEYFYKSPVDKRSQTSQEQSVGPSFIHGDTERVCGFTGIKYPAASNGVSFLYRPMGREYGLGGLPSAEKKSRSADALRLHGVGHLLEAGDVGASHIVALHAVLLRGSVQVVEDIDHDGL